MKEHDMLIEARQLEKDCAELIRKFCEKTGVVVFQQIDVEIHLLHSIGKDVTLTRFDIEVKI